MSTVASDFINFASVHRLRHQRSSHVLSSTSAPLRKIAKSKISFCNAILPIGTAFSTISLRAGLSAKASSASSVLTHAGHIALTQMFYGALSMASFLSQDSVRRGNTLPALLGIPNKACLAAVYWTMPDTVTYKSSDPKLTMTPRPRSDSTVLPCHFRGSCFFIA